jgi:hypothetical protein
MKFTGCRYVPLLRVRVSGPTGSPGIFHKRESCRRRFACDGRLALPSCDYLHLRGRFPLVPWRYSSCLLLLFWFHRNLELLRTARVFLVCYLSTQFDSMSLIPPVVTCVLMLLSIPQLCFYRSSYLYFPWFQSVRRRPRCAELRSSLADGGSTLYPSQNPPRD